MPVLLSLQASPVLGVATHAPVDLLQAIVLHWPVGSFPGSWQLTGVPTQVPD
ncbi:MAG TPA: hypothetical protein VGH20_06755 [Myxococcales bacterium]